MNNIRGKKSKAEQGIALIVALMVLLLLSAALMGMIMMSNTETNVSANFRDEQTAFFGSKAGIEEVRDRMRSGATNSLASSLPATVSHNRTANSDPRVDVTSRCPSGENAAEIT